MKRKSAFSVLVLFVCIPMLLFFQNFTSVQTTFYVSVNGNDVSGDGSLSSPYRTLQKALMVVNEALKTSHATIRFVEREFTLDSPIEINSANFHSAQHRGNRLYILGSTQGKTLLSGGQKFIGGTLENGLWKIPVGAGKNFRQLYINGHKGQRARTKEGQDLGISSACDSAKSPESCFRGYRVCDSPTRAKECAPSQLRGINNWKNKDQIEIVMKYQWMMPRCRLGSYSKASASIYGILTPIAQSPTVPQDGDYCWDRITNNGVKKYPTVLWVENAIELLDEPNEWYYDSVSGFLYYKPLLNEPLEKSEIIIPQLDYLIKVSGTFAAPIQNITFQGLVFSHSMNRVINDSGKAPEHQKYIDGEHGFPEHQANVLANGYGIRGAVQVLYAKGFEFSQNVFTHLGGAGLELTEGVQNSYVARNVFHDIAGGAVVVGHTRSSAYLGAGNYLPNKEIDIDTNSIFNIGTEYWGAVGIFASYVDTVRVRNNHLFDLPYTGISFGYSWGSRDFDVNGNATPTPAKNNSILGNVIERHVTKLADGGGIYTLGRQPGTLIQHNVIRDQVNEYGALYLDMCSGGISALRNIIYSNKRTLIYKGYENVVRDNFWEVRNSGDLYNVGDPAEARCTSYKGYAASVTRVSTSENTTVTLGTMTKHKVVNDVLASAGVPGSVSEKMVPEVPASLGVYCSATGIRMQWSHSAGAQRYYVRIDDTANNSGATWYFAGSNDRRFDDVHTANLFTKLPKGSYRVWVHAVNSYGYSDAKVASLMCN